LHIVEDVVRHETLRRHGRTVRPDPLDAARNADGFILGLTVALSIPA
jgi:3-isopropylmalate dehydrogenase